MEILPGLRNPMYLAHSVGDMVDNRDRVADEVWEPHEQKEKRGFWPISIHSQDEHFVVEFDLTLPSPSRMVKKMLWLPDPGVRYGCLIYVPRVYHLPFDPEDTNEPRKGDLDNNPNKLKIFDLNDSGFCEVMRLSDSTTKHVHEAAYRPNFPVLKQTVWSSDVILRARYAKDPKFDEYGLLAVINRAANQSVDESVGEVVRSLQFAPHIARSH